MVTSLSKTTKNEVTKMGWNAQKLVLTNVRKNMDWEKTFSNSSLKDEKFSIFCDHSSEGVLKQNSTLFYDTEAAFML